MLSCYYNSCEYKDKCEESYFYDYFKSSCVLDNSYATKSYAVNVYHRPPCCYCEHRKIKYFFDLPSCNFCEFNKENQDEL